MQALDTATTAWLARGVAWARRLLRNHLVLDLFAADLECER